MMGGTGKESFEHLLGQGDEYELESPGAPLYDMRDPKDRAAVDWRVSCFTGAGMELPAAAAVAVRKDIDRSDVERMLSAGATSAQVCDVLL